MPTPKKSSKELSKDPSIDINPLLTAEFEYIAHTTTEAHEDRARVSSFYLAAVGSLVAALFGAQFFNGGNLTPFSTILLSILFSLLTLLGASAVWQLGRLRVAWYESMLAMNKIKDFVIDHNPETADAFRWRTGSIPKPAKSSSIAFFQAVEVSVISGLMMAAAIFFILLTLHQTVDLMHWVAAIAGGIAMIVGDIAIYKLSVK